MTKKLTDIPFERYSDGKIKRTDKNHQLLKQGLNETGSGMCLAKWSQVTMHLGTGLTHSCHHPIAHKIPLDELKDNPSALHNTNFKKQQRKDMLNGKRPAECDFCWRIEDNTDEISDRVYKSIDDFSIVDYDEIVNSTGDENVYPRYVEVDFSHVCNFKCSYCGPTYSSKWVEEIQQKGAYQFSSGQPFNNISEVPIKNSDQNPYTDAFWEWFPDALPHLHTFRITGGEPLLSKHTFKVFEYLLENPNPNLEFAINTNACPPGKLWDRLVKLVQQLEQRNCVKKFTLFISAESVGEAAEYSRRGLNWRLFETNLEYFLDNTTTTRIAVMSAFNVMSITTFVDLLKYVYELKCKYGRDGILDWMVSKGVDPVHIDPNLVNYRELNTPPKECMQRVAIDIPYVRHPDFLDANIINVELIEKYLVPAVAYMYSHMANHNFVGSMGFDQREADKLKRILVDILSVASNNRNTDGTTTRADIRKQRARFYEFIIEYDQRNLLKFAEVFPDMIEFYALCKTEYEKDN